LPNRYPLAPLSVPSAPWPQARRPRPLRCRAARFLWSTAAVAAALALAAPAEARDPCFYNDRAEQYESVGNFDMAIACYTQSLALDPTQSTAYNNRGYDWYRKQEYGKAIADYNQSLAICPNNAAALGNRGVVYDDLHDHERATADFNQALAIDPNFAMAYNNRGATNSTLGCFAQAEADFRQALAICPDDPTTLENLAFLQATCPDARFRDGQRAFASASRAYQLQGIRDPYFTANALAAAYAECGDFPKAILWQAKTVEFAPTADTALQSARLELFKQGHPYRSKVEKRAETIPPGPVLPAP
jgi:tetratricopeptide (TPR) repeat protein